MNTNNYHEEIKKKLNCFIEQNKIPHLLFHGPYGSGKKTLVSNFISDIYNNDKALINLYTVFADCAQSKGIKFIREELKFFAKTNIDNHYFKTIILTNADKLTTDAQSALRRCIELFSHSTRFFIIVENKYGLLKPILSRLCEIYVDYVQFRTITPDKPHELWLNTEFTKLKPGVIILGLESATASATDASATDSITSEISNFVNKLYEKSYSGLDLMNYIEQSHELNELHKYKLLMLFHRVKHEFRSEKLFMTFILTFLFVRSNSDLENILPM